MASAARTLKKTIDVTAWLERKARECEKNKLYREATVYLSKLLARLTRTASATSIDVTDLAAIHYRLGLAHRALRDSSKSLYHLKYSIRLNAHEPRYYEAFGKAFLSGGHWRVAKTQFEQAVQLDPKNAIYLRQYAWVLLMMGQKAEALSYAKKALQLKPADKENHLIVVRAYMESGMYLDAVAHLKRLSISSPKIKTLLKDCYEKLEGSFDGSVLWWLKKGLLCDGRPFTIKDLRTAEAHWIQFCLHTKSHERVVQQPVVWAAALSWLVHYKNETPAFENSDSSFILERFNVASVDVWPMIKKLSEVLKPL